MVLSTIRKENRRATNRPERLNRETPDGPRPTKRMIPDFRVFVDFDGTLVDPNVAILLVERFCEGGATLAHDVDRQLHSGEITLREAWNRQAALLPGDRLQEMSDWAVANVPLRSGAKEFLNFLEERRTPVVVVSGGLDFYIQAVLRRENLSVPFLSDRLNRMDRGRVEVLHPYGHATCRLCGICKAQIVRSIVPSAERTVFIGDGSTDRYGAEVADIVFARHRLKSYCQRSNVPFISFEDFHDIRRTFDNWFAGREPVPVRASLGLMESPCPISQSISSGRASAGVLPAGIGTHPNGPPEDSTPSRASRPG